MKSTKLDLFLKKLAMIQFLTIKYRFNYMEIAYILDDSPEVIENYSTQILKLK